MTETVYPIYNRHSTASVSATAQDNALSPLMSVSRTHESNERSRRLFLDGKYSQASPKSLRTMADAAYQVPTGYTAKIILITRLTDDQDGQVRVFESSTADTGTGTLKYEGEGIALMDRLSNEMLSISPDWHIPERSFAAGKYITMSFRNGSDNGSIVSAVAIETPV